MNDSINPPIKIEHVCLANQASYQNGAVLPRLDPTGGSYPHPLVR